MFYQSQWLPVFARTGSGGLEMLDGRKKKGGHCRLYAARLQCEESHETFIANAGEGTLEGPLLGLIYHGGHCGIQ